MLVVSFLIWLGTLPLIFWHGSYEGPKVIWFIAGGLVLVIFWIVRILKKKRNLELLKADLVYFLWLGIMLISGLLNQSQSGISIGESYRHQGIVFFFVLWVLGKTIQILKGKEKKWLVKTISAVVILESLVVVFQIFSGNLHFSKPLGTLGEANAVAGFLVISSFFLYETFDKRYLILPFVSFLAAQSRSGILAALPFMAMYAGSRIRKSGNPIIIFVGASLIGAFILISTGKGNSIFENRPIIWKAGIEAILQKPFLGYGAESGQVVYDTAFRKMEMPLSGLIIDRSHNLFLDIAMWSGIAGLILFGWWLFLSHKTLKFNRKLALCSFLIYSMFQPLSVVHWVLLFVILNA